MSEPDRLAWRAPGAQLVAELVVGIPPGPLPFRTAPLGGETIASYLSRTAAASHLAAGAITACLSPWFAARAAACDDLAPTGQPQPADIQHLAALTGTSETAMRHGLPALAGNRDDGRPAVRATAACRRCAARHGQHDPVPVHLPAHQKACQRHRTWLGRAIQIDLATVPDIIHASRQASRLARQHGITRLVLAETAARLTQLDDVFGKFGFAESPGSFSFDKPCSC